MLYITESIGGFMNNYNDFCTQLSDCGIKFKTNEPMSNHTTFKIGGNASVLAYAQNETQLVKILDLCKIHSLPYFVLGNGSNLLVSDNGLDCVVIRLDGDFKLIKKISDTTLYCGAGATLARLCKTALSYELSGLEFAWGIPGSVGGAAYMNAGAYTGEMKDVTVSCTHITPDGEKGKLQGDDLCFSYRNSAYKKNKYIITGITVELQKSDKDEINEKMQDFMNRRKSKQPIELPSAGSVFKRPTGNFAGALVEQCGLKGLSIGDAQVSPKHCGFIVNNGNATAKDVQSLIDKIKKTVAEKTGVMLEQEIISIGN